MSFPNLDLATVALVLAGVVFLVVYVRTLFGLAGAKGNPYQTGFRGFALPILLIGKGWSREGSYHLLAHLPLSGFGAFFRTLSNNPGLRRLWWSTQLALAVLVAVWLWWRVA